MTFICQYDNSEFVKYVCLNRDCVSSRKVCEYHLDQHRLHLQDCFELSFLIYILYKELLKLAICAQFNSQYNFHSYIEKLYDDIHQIINNLRDENEQPIAIQKNLKLIIKCYYSEIEEEIIHLAYVELLGKTSELDKTIAQIRECYKFEQQDYLIQKSIQAGQVLQIAGEYEQAIQYYSQGLQLCPKNQRKIKEQITDFLASIHCQIKNYSQAAKEIYEGLDFQQENSNKNDFKIFAQTILSEIDEYSFFPIFLEFIQQSKLLFFLLQPNMHNISNLLRQKKYEDALSQVELILKDGGLKQNFQHCLIKCYCLIAMSKFQDAHNFIQDCLTLHQNNESFLVFKALILLLQGNFNEFKNLIKQFPNIEKNQHFQIVNALFYLLTAQYEKCNQQFQYFESIKQNRIIQVMKVLVLLQINNQKDALEILNSITKPKRNLEIAILRWKDEFQEALDNIVFDKAQDLYQTSNKWSDELTTLYEMQDYVQIQLTPYVELDLYKLRNTIIRSFAFFKLEKYNESYSQLILLKSMIQNPQQLVILYYEGQLLYQLGRTEEALVKFENCYQSCYDFYKALYCRAIILCVQGQFGKAILVIDQVLVFDKCYYPAIYNKGVALLLTGCYPEAEICFTSVKNNISNSQILIFYCKFLQGKFGEALTLINSLIKVNQLRGLIILQCLTYTLLDNYQQALLSLNQFIQKEEQSKYDLLFEYCFTQIQNNKIDLGDLQNQVPLRNIDQKDNLQKDLPQPSDLIMKLLKAELADQLLDLSELSNIPNKIDLFHCQIDFVGSFFKFLDELI